MRAQLFVNYGSIFFLLLSLPIAFLMDRPGGFRAATIFSAGCNLGGCILRLFARSDSDTSIALLHASYVVNALGGPGTRCTIFASPTHSTQNI